MVGKTKVIKMGTDRISNDKSASIRQPDWHRHLDVKRPTLSCDLRRVVRSQSAVCRQYVQVTSPNRTSEQSSGRRTRRSAVAHGHLRHGDTSTTIRSRAQQASFCVADDQRASVWLERKGRHPTRMSARLQEEISSLTTPIASYQGEAACRWKRQRPASPVGLTCSAGSRGSSQNRQCSIRRSRSRSCWHKARYPARRPCLRPGREK